MVKKILACFLCPTVYMYCITSTFFSSFFCRWPIEIAAAGFYQTKCLPVAQQRSSRKVKWKWKKRCRNTGRLWQQRSCLVLHRSSRSDSRRTPPARGSLVAVHSASTWMSAPSEQPLAERHTKQTFHKCSTVTFTIHHQHQCTSCSKKLITKRVWIT